jgi:hypothetical protein
MKIASTKMENMELRKRRFKLDFLGHLVLRFFELLNLPRSIKSLKVN